MLVDIFIVMLVISFLLFILAVEEESLVYSMLSLVFWIVTGVQALFLSDVAGNYYYEFGVSALCLGFIFASLILTIVNNKKWNVRGKLP